MTHTDKTGGPAFPRPQSTDAEREHNHYVIREQNGMTLRDYFAAHALTALLTMQKETDCPADVFAKDAYFYANAMIKARAAE